MSRTRKVNVDAGQVTFARFKDGGPRYDRARLADCEQWVATSFVLELDMPGPNGITAPTRYVMDTIATCGSDAEPTLLLTLKGKWVIRVPHDPSIKPRPPQYIQVTEDHAIQWLSANGYSPPGHIKLDPRNERMRRRRTPKDHERFAYDKWV
jgi:hypothetical protein